MFHPHLKETEKQGHLLVLTRAVLNRPGNHGAMTRELRLHLIRENSSQKQFFIFSPNVFANCMVVGEQFIPSFIFSRECEKMSGPACKLVSGNENVFTQYMYFLEEREG